MEKEYIAQFTTSIQMTECEWEIKTPSMKIKPSTTIKEIESFYRKWNKTGEMQVKIIELEK